MRRPGGPYAEDLQERPKPRDWTPREMRHSFVSLLSNSGLPLEVISLLVGHKSTVVTEIVYRQQIRPVLQGGPVAMNEIFRLAEEVKPAGP